MSGGKHMAGHSDRGLDDERVARCLARGPIADELFLGFNRTGPSSRTVFFLDTLVHET